MKRFRICFAILTGVFLLFAMMAYSPSPAMAQKAEKKAQKAKADKTSYNAEAWETWSKPNAAFDAGKMGDMSGYDPAKWVNPEGDTIKIAVVWPHSGPGALNGELAWACITFVAYDINQRGGIFVDGKKKKIALFKADNMSKPDQAKKVCERMVLQEKVHILMGTSGSNMLKIINEVANKYKVIAEYRLPG